MYPVLNNCRVRGIEGDFYLQQYLSGSEFVLEPLHAKILSCCDGEKSIDQIVSEFALPKDDLVSFFSVLQEADLLKMQERQQKTIVIAPIGEPPYLREVHIDATGRCNLYGICKHCYGRGNFQEASKKELTTLELCKLFDEMAGLNVASCVLSGGEVFMRKDLPRLVVELAERGICLTGIFTNGTLYRHDVIEALNGTGMKTFFFVSLDGHTPEINDALRGNGNFEKTVAFLKRVKAAGFPIIVNTMVMKQNVREMMGMCEFLEQMEVNRWRLSVPREQGEAIIHKDLIIPGWEDVFTAYRELLQHALVKTGPMKMQIGSIFKSELLEDPVYYLFNPGNSCCEYKRSAIVVKPNGDVTPCTAFENLVLGNVRDTSLGEIWRSELTQSFKSLPVSATECRDCEIKEYCGGGCRKIAWEIHGSVLAKDDNSCPLYDFADKIARPMLESRGIRAEFLKKPSDYRFDPLAIDKAITSRLK